MNQAADNKKRNLWQSSRTKAAIHLVIGLAVFNSADQALAEFTLNFLPEANRLQDPEWLNFNCNRGRAPGGGFEDCDDNDEFRGDNGRDQTAFLMERVRGDDGEQYYHVIIGEPTDDFVQESYIKITRYFDDDERLTDRQQEVDDLGPLSDSLGDFTDISEGPDNAYDPLGPASFSGSGTANPNSTIFRQITAGGGMVQEIIKDQYSRKPIIHQTLDTDSVRAEFVMDMSNSTYADANTAGLMQNTIIITQPNFESRFDVALDGDDVNISGGKFEYVDYGVYTGEGAGFDIYTVDWWQFRDPDQNRGHLYGCDEDCFGPGGDNDD